VAGLGENLDRQTLANILLDMEVPLGRIEAKEILCSRAGGGRAKKVLSPRIDRSAVIKGRIQLLAWLVTVNDNI
jgi:hypothetical protein